MKYVPPVGATDPNAGYVTGDPATDTEGSPVAAEAIEHPMREIVNAIIALGGTPDQNDLTQLGTLLLAKFSTGVLPLAALPYPTIATADNRLAVTAAAVAGSGGTVSIGAGTRLSLAEEITAGINGRMREWVTPAFTSAALAVSSTYYLRAQITAGVLSLYVTKGADSDALVLPAGLRGTPNASAGGGFDSTALDLLIARVVTGGAGTAPTITTLANSWRLTAQFIGGFDSTANSNGWYPHTLNWARTPKTRGLSSVGDMSSLGFTTDMLQTIGTTRYLVSVYSAGYDSSGYNCYFKPAYVAELAA